MNGKKEFRISDFGFRILRPFKFAPVKRVLYRTIRNSQFAIFFFCLLYAEAPKGVVGDVTIKGEEKGRLKSDKPPLSFPLNENQEVIPALKTEEEVLKQESSIFKRKPPLPATLKSPMAVIPYRALIQGEPVRLFWPLKELEAVHKEEHLQHAKEKAKWTYAVADAAGETFKEWRGIGLPPESILFDGRDEKGNMLQVGLAYSAVLVYADSDGKRYTATGAPFRFMGLKYQDAGGFLIQLDVQALWGKSLESVEDFSFFSEQGRDLLQETADWIKRLYIQYPIQLRLYVPQKKETIEPAAVALVNALTDLLKLEPNTIPFAVQTSPAFLSKAELFIKNR